MPQSPTQPFGQHGERLAAEYLKRQGYHIVATNWRCKHGEIDIIALKEKTLVFVEVRTRRAKDTESAFESITKRKQKRMMASVQTYIAVQNLDAMDWRVDVIAIAISGTDRPTIEHAEDALGW